MTYQRPAMGTATPKPMRGMSLVKRRQTRASAAKAEQKSMQAALARDGKQCRLPGCAYKKLKVTVDPCHMVHRGMGGNPKGDRTTRAMVIALCRVHHGIYDAGDIRIEPLTAQDFDGPCEFYMRGDNGKFFHIATEKRIGVSVAVGL